MWSNGDEKFDVWKAIYAFFVYFCGFKRLEKIMKRQKKIKSKLYTKGKFGKRIREILFTDTEYLYEEGRRKSNIRQEDLPEDYLKINSRTLWYMDGFVKLSDVKFAYCTIIHENHYRKDDYIYISYDSEISEEKDEYGFRNVIGYDYCFCGNEIEDIIRGIERFSPEVDLSQVKAVLKEKDEYLLENHPECLPDERSHL